MPITVEIIDEPTKEIFEKIFSFFDYVDQTFSTYKYTSEVSKINRGELDENLFSEDIKTVLKLSEQTKKTTNGFFDIRTPEGKIDPSGLVKGWAIHEASKILKDLHYQNFYIDAGGDIQVSRPENISEPWKIGIRNPFNENEIVKIINLRNGGVATSGSYNRGAHIYDPKNKNSLLNEIVSLTVVGPNIYDADRFATAAFAMGKNGIYFLENIPDLEAYAIDKNGTATFTTNFDKYLI